MKSRSIMILLFFFIVILTTSSNAEIENINVKLSVNGIRIMLTDDNDEKLSLFTNAGHYYVPIDTFIETVGGTWDYDAERNMLMLTLPTTAISGQPEEIPDSYMSTVSSTYTPMPSFDSNTYGIFASELTWSKDILGDTAIKVAFINKLDSIIDRIDFKITCYDVYGGQLKSYGFYTGSTAFIDGMSIGKNEQTSFQTYALSGYSGVAEVRIAVTKYHTKSGTTVTIPEKDYNWVSFIKD